MTSATTAGRPLRPDLVVVGAGVVGLGAALAALDRGLSVVVVERDAVASGASVRNFGHGCVTAQAGEALEHARASRETWRRLARDAGFWLGEGGTVVVARHADELAVLADVAAGRGDEVVLLDGDEVARRVPVVGAVGGAALPGDVRLDPREALAAVTAHLVARGARVLTGTSVLGVDERGVDTSRGRLDAGAVVVAVGHDVDQLLPDLAAGAGVQRCSLHMLRVADPHGRRIEPAVLTGWSLMRYAGFASSPLVGAVRERLASELPDAAAADLHLMLTQMPGGDLVVGDTHALAATASPFRREELDELVLREAAALLGAERLVVRERWLGVYAAAPRPFLVDAPLPCLRVVSVTTGIGMTTAFGLSARVVEDLVA